MCDHYCGGFLWRLLSIQQHEMSLYRNYKVWRMVCATEAAQAREQSSWEYLQWAQERRLTKGTTSFSQRSWESRETEPGAPAGDCHPGQGSSGTEPLLTLQLLNTEQHVHRSAGGALPCPLYLLGCVSDPPVRLSTPCLLLTLLTLSLLSRFILSCTHIYNQTTQQVGSILVTWKPDRDINTWRSHMLVFSLRTHKFYWSMIWK